MEQAYVKSRAMKHQCPYCHTQHDMCTGASLSQEGVIPCEGDVTLCASCGTVLRFAPEHTLVYATRDNWLEVEPRLRAAIAKSIGKHIRFGATNG